MKENEPKIDRTRHAVYTKACREEIIKHIAAHYPEEQVDEVFETFQNRYAEYLNAWDEDLGGEKNFRNKGAGGTFDSIALLCLYSVCKDVISVSELEEMETNLVLSTFKALSKLRIANGNRAFIKKILYKSFTSAKKSGDQYQDFVMKLYPFDKNKPIHYEFGTCPIVDFAKKFHLEEAMPAMCNADYPAMACMRIKLIRPETLAFSDKCDYSFVGDEELYAKEHPEYVDENGFRRNR
ncbi:L-2-amino-thiazoline-4-carboxylic acid hydrolase [Pseudoramibacter sp. HA2172]|uniref:L-2-amino-thiazoline-4-carboxylic acid hydrolase n=1 Tax=Pseudoramibacter faecis TaxID=3108534 RepID=UPI002E79B26D|nr:L-2-amino-thiazoline-4-carboxylic acid hydrolase [Pseudoramibacter sp. HA2172]